MGELLDLTALLKRDGNDGEETYSMVFPFTNDTPDFAEGFEAGQIYEQMKTGVEIIEKTIHWKNMQQLSIMCKAMDYQIINQAKTEEYVDVKIQNNIRVV